MDKVYEETKKTLLHDESAVVVKIEKTNGSTPGKEGCVMLICPNGNTYGTIGGGELELFCSKAALDVYKTKQSYTRDFCLDSLKKDSVSMICGGDVSVSFNYLTNNSSQETFEKIFALSAVRPRALIFGGGHVGKELCPVLDNVGFDVVVLDDRPDFATKELHPKAKECIEVNYEDISSKIKATEDDYIIIMTHGHLGDRSVLLWACRTGAKYIGCIGSKKKVALTQQYLRENGICEDIISKVNSPIGLPIGGDSPQEIAISVAAQVIQTRYGKTDIDPKS